MLFGLPWGMGRLAIHLRSMTPEVDPDLGAMKDEAP